MTLADIVNKTRTRTLKELAQLNENFQSRLQAQVLNYLAEPARTLAEYSEALQQLEAADEFVQGNVISNLVSGTNRIDFTTWEMLDAPKIDSIKRITEILSKEAAFPVCLTASAKYSEQLSAYVPAADGIVYPNLLKQLMQNPSFSEPFSGQQVQTHEGISVLTSRISDINGKYSRIKKEITGRTAVKIPLSKLLKERTIEYVKNALGLKTNKEIDSLLKVSYSIEAEVAELPGLIADASEDAKDSIRREKRELAPPESTSAKPRKAGAPSKVYGLTELKEAGLLEKAGRLPGSLDYLPKRIKSLLLSKQVEQHQLEDVIDYLVPSSAFMEMNVGHDHITNPEYSIARKKISQLSEISSLQIAGKSYYTPIEAYKLIEAVMGTYGKKKNETPLFTFEKVVEMINWGNPEKKVSQEQVRQYCNTMHNQHNDVMMRKNGGFEFQKAGTFVSNKYVFEIVNHFRHYKENL